MAKNTIEVVIVAAFDAEIESNSEADGYCDLDALDDYIASVRRGLAEIEQTRAQYVPLTVAERIERNKTFHRTNSGSK